MATGFQFKRFKFFLNPRGTGEQELDNAPDGWTDTQISYTRSDTYSGLQRTFTSTLKLVRQGAFIARREFWVYGLMANVVIRVQKGFGRLQFKDLFTGKLDFSKASDSITSFSINAVPSDFTQNIDAYDSVKYAIPLNVPEAINLEITAIPLFEQATILFNPSTDSRSNCFRDTTVANNQQNSLVNSVQPTGFFAQVNPDFSVSGYWSYLCRVDNAVQVTGDFTGKVLGPQNLQYSYSGSFVKSDGTILKQVFLTPVILHPGEYDFSTTWDFTVKMLKGERIYFYIKNESDPDTNAGVNVVSGTMNFSYQTVSPNTMCQAMRAADLFPRILQAMNFNNDSGPNLPVPSQSFLLTGYWRQLVYTCSDSIRAAQGSIYIAGQQIFPGVYQVLAGSVVYNSNTYNTGDTFSYVDGFTLFTGSGVVQKIQSISVGNVYNAGDTLQAGGVFLVGGDPGTHLTYNSIAYGIGKEFKYVLGQDTFTVSDDSVFAKQISEDPQLVISLADFFQDFKSLQGGDCALGIENGTTWMEKLSYPYRAGINQLSLGIVAADVKLEPAIDKQYNTIKAGYADQQYDSLNGSQEVNSTQEYSTAITAIQKELNLVAVSRFDPYGIETIRITQTDSAASRSDNDCFGIYIKPEAEATVGGYSYYHPLRTEGLMVNTVTGLPMISGVSVSYYNWWLSPKRNMLRGGAYLASIFYNMPGYFITQQSALKNNALVTVDLAGLRVAESDPISISDLPPAIFAPYYATVTAGSPDSVLDMLDSTPYADLNFDTQGINVKAFVNEFTLQVGNDEPQSVKLLLTADNDLTKFIR